MVNYTDIGLYNDYEVKRGVRIRAVKEGCIKLRFLGFFKP